MNNLLETYTWDEIFTKTESDIACSVKLRNMLLPEFANEIWLKRLRCPHVFDEYVFKEIFVE